ncbi:MAG: YafY family transcriptional regulator, partial [Bacilli bacterium]|nr:YafY family transcriptional regulator [Bacilli bacterium]
MKNNRLFGILYLLLVKKRITANELADYFEVSVRTIYRDIETLSSYEIPIYMSKGKNGGITLLETYTLDKILLTEKEQKEILFSVQAMDELNCNNNKLLDKMKAIFKNEEKNFIDVDFGIWENSLEHQQNFNTIKKAIIEKRKITFTYFNSYGEISDRNVEPLQLQFQYNSWYLLGYDTNKNDYRFFKLMRIDSIMLLEEQFSRTIPDKKIDFESLTNKTKITLEIKKELSYRVYDEFDTSSITKLEN